MKRWMGSVAVVAALWGLGGCGAALADMQKAAESVTSGEATSGESAGEEKPAVVEAVEHPTKALAEASGPDGSNATCCVNGAFYTCPSAAAATQCLGEPMRLMSCMQECTGDDGSCENGCAEKHGPDPSSCQRDASGDASCAKN